MRVEPGTGFVSHLSSRFLVAHRVDPGYPVFCVAGLRVFASRHKDNKLRLSKEVAVFHTRFGWFWVLPFDSLRDNPGLFRNTIGFDIIKSCSMVFSRELQIFFAEIFGLDHSDSAIG